MDMDIRVLEFIAVQPKLFGTRARVTQGCLGALLHDLAQVTGQRQRSLAGHQGHLDRQRISSCLRPGDPHSNTHLVLGKQQGAGDTRRPQELGQASGRDALGIATLLGDTPGDLPEDVRDLSLQVANARLVGVLADDHLDGLLLKPDPHFLQAMRRQLPGDEKLPGNMHFFFFNVTGELDDLHPILQSGRDRIDVVRGGHEHDLAQIVVHLKIMIGEGVVLLRVKHLQERSRRVAPEVSAQLVDLVQHEQRVDRASAAHDLDDPTGHRPDIRSPVAANLRLVTHPTQGDPDEIAAKRLGDRFAQRGFARPRRPDKTQDRGLHLIQGQLADGDVLQNALFRLLKAIMLFVQDFGGVVDIEVVFRLVRPGKLQEPIQVGSDDPDFRSERRHASQATKLLAGLLLDHIGHLDRLKFIVQLGDLLLEDIGLPQLALDDSHLFAQEQLALRFIDGLLNPVVNLVFQLQHVKLFAQQNAHSQQTIRRVVHLQQFLPLDCGQVQGGRHQVGQPARLLDVHRKDVGIFRQVAVEINALLKQSQHRPHAGLDLVGMVGLFDDRMGLHPEVRVILLIVDNLDAPSPLDEDAQSPIRHAQHASQRKLDTRIVDVALAGVLKLRVFLGRADDRLMGLLGRVNSLKGAAAPDKQRRHHIGINNQVAQGD